MRESAADPGSSSNGSEHAAGSAASTSANDDVVVVSSVSNKEPAPSSQQRHFRNLHLQSGLVDSPLLAALSSSPPPPMPMPTSSLVPTTTSTPLLKASLNSPPVAHHRATSSAAATSSSSSSGNNNSSSSSSSPTTSMASSSSSSSPSLKTAAASCNGSVDLSMAGRKRRSDASPPSSSLESKRPTSEMYANLIMQLRQQNQATVALVSSNGNTVKTVPATTNSGSSRKERLKCQPSFQCPVCKKRFQRHIAMNAHFQNEHIASGPGEEKICKLCSHRTGGITGIRMHLLREHQIDLERPTSFLVEPAESNPSSPMAGSADRMLQPATVTVHLTSCSPNNSNAASGKTTQQVKVRGFAESGASPAGSRSSSASPAPAVSIEAFPVKKEAPPPTSKPKLPEVTVTSEDVLISEHARDLSMRRVSMTPSPPTAPLVKKKRLENPPAAVASPSPQWQCQHCNIVFPNQTLYFLHRGFHSESNPWRCNGCGYACQDMFDFNTHLVSEAHG